MSMEFNTDEVKSLVWGQEGINESVFDRWNQGFVFSGDEPSVLVQYEGGPCSVIAPVQSYIFKNMCQKHRDTWQKLTPEQADSLLAASLCEVLRRCASSDGAPARLVVPGGSEHVPETTSENDGEGAPSVELPSRKRRRILPADFHSNLRLVEVPSSEDLEDYFLKNISVYRSDGGVLAFMYSAVQTKGVSLVRAEMSDSDEPLIDSVHGHGSQSLTSMFITGRASAHVWDNVRYVDGIALEGVLAQPAVGFLTVLERLRYCTVGWNLKNPQHPVWVVASETHLSVLFSTDVRLAPPPSPRQVAQRAFEKLDRDQAGFIPTCLLGDLMVECQLVADEEYVELMRATLDPDQLGIVLLVPFLDEFFPEKADSRPPDAFTLYHCNGLVRSNPDGKVRLVKGDACLLETNVQSSTSTNTILTCLQSKWPRIDVRWQGGLTPSIN